MPRHRKPRLPAEVGPPAVVAPLAETPAQREASGGCPSCGGHDWQRSRRRFWERLIGRRQMVRCRACRARFPRPLPGSW